jgi:hypothetical protein
MHARTWFDLYRLDEETTRRRTPQSWRLELPKLQVFLQYPTEFFAELLLSLGRVQDNVLYRNRQCVNSWCVPRNHPCNTDAGQVDNCVYRNRSVSCRKCIFRSFALTIRQMSRWKTGISHAGSQHFEDVARKRKYSWNTTKLWFFTELLRRCSNVPWSHQVFDWAVDRPEKVLELVENGIFAAKMTLVSRSVSRSLSSPLRRLQGSALHSWSQVFVRYRNKMRDFSRSSAAIISKPRRSPSSP